MLKSITVLGLAEGAGATALAANLSAEAVHLGLKVAVHDLDRVSRDLERWIESRLPECPAIGPIRFDGVDGAPFWEAHVDMMNAGFDLAIIDTPGERWMNVLDAVGSSDLVLVVCAPTAVVAVEVEETMAILRNAGVPFRFVLNRSSGPSEAATLRALAELREHGAVLDTAVGEDAVFAVAMDRGLAAGELEPRGAAATTVRMLWAEVWALLTGGAEPVPPAGGLRPSATG